MSSLGNSAGTIRKTVGEPLERLSPFQRLERLRQNAAPFTRQKKYEESDSFLVRKTVGAPRQEQG